MIKDEQAKFDAFIQSQQGEYTSGKGSVMPDELRGFNWGGLTMNFVWGLFMHIPWTWLHLVPIVGMVMPLVFWVRGNELAWRYRKWQSIEHFKAVQKNWAYAGFLFLVLNVLIYIWLMSWMTDYINRMFL